VAQHGEVDIACRLQSNAAMRWGITSCKNKNERDLGFEYQAIAED
jgi:hypothetical protein